MGNIKNNIEWNIWDDIERNLNSNIVLKIWDNIRWNINDNIGRNISTPIKQVLRNETINFRY